MPQEACLNLLTVLSQPHFFTHEETWIELEKVYQRLQKAQLHPYYNDAVRFEEDIAWLSHQGYLMHRGTEAVCVNPNGIEKIKGRILPEEWRPIGYQTGRAAWLRRRDEKKRKYNVSTKGGKTMTSTDWVVVIGGFAIVAVLFYYFR
ncbi:MAG: hypothetical protein HY001_00760 [Candidatus Portnoybacteria bacterium]|nr:hypothetical protein [Candidatus Portnoybacteria bacterium]